MNPNDPKPHSSVEPVQLGLEDRFRFRCHRHIPCFNACCRNIDILLTPYDLLRLKRRLGLTSRALIDAHTRDFTLDAHGMPGLKLATKPGTQECVFLTPEGCGIYEDRPAACRYYALGLLSLRKTGSPDDEDSYFVVKEDHCLGHFEPHEQNVADYRTEQGLPPYDDANREWRRIILKKRSAGPTIGTPSSRSFELFFLASYDLEGFLAFVTSPGFQELFELEPDFLQQLCDQEEIRLQFALRFLRQVLFGENTIPLREAAVQVRRARYREKVQHIEEEARRLREAGEDLSVEDFEE